MARILIIDDESQVRELVREMLERDGHEVSEAGNGEEGLRSLDAWPADLIITDILMPQKGGLPTIRAIRQKFPAAKILAISGGGRNGRLNFLSTARTFSGVRTLDKPFRRTELIGAVRELLNEAP